MKSVSEEQELGLWVKIEGLEEKIESLSRDIIFAKLGIAFVIGLLLYQIFS